MEYKLTKLQMRTLKGMKFVKMMPRLYEMLLGATVWKEAKENGIDITEIKLPREQIDELIKAASGNEPEETRSAVLMGWLNYGPSAISDTTQGAVP